MAEVQIVIFNLNKELWGVETSQVQEIEKYEEPTKLPKMPDFIDGVIDLRGRVVPVINLNKRFGFGDTEINKKTKIIVINNEGTLTGFIVNDVSEIVKIPEGDIESTPEVLQFSSNKYLKSIAKKNEKLVSILDLDKILSEQEKGKLVEKQ